MADILVEKLNNVFLQIKAKEYILDELNDYFRFRPDGYQFTPAYRNRLWDGYTRLFNYMDCTLPFGLLHYLRDFAKSRDYTIQENFSTKKSPIESDRFSSFVEGLNLPFELREYQIDGIKRAIQNERILLISPTGSGKSAYIYTLSRWWEDKKILVIVPTLSLIHQMKSDFADYAKKDGSFDVDENVHLIYGGQDKDTDKRIIIGTWQSLFKLPKQWFADIDMVICDEAHLGKSNSIKNILQKLENAEIRIGTTGTLDGTKVNQLILEGYLGPVYHVIDTKTLMDQNYLSKLNIQCMLLSYDKDECSVVKNLKYADEVKYILKHQKRNKFITNLVNVIPNNTLILFEYVDSHGKVLYEQIKQKVVNRNVYFIYGGTPAEEREAIRKKVESDTNAIIVASVKVFSTGVNIKNLYSIVFVTPSKSRIRTLQSIGRSLRLGDRSNQATLYDIADNFQHGKRLNYVLKHFIQRCKIYDQEQFDYKVHKIKI